MAPRIRKRNLIVSYNNLDDTLKELFKEKYPDGYRDYLQRTEKPNGDIIFCAPMETEDTMYMVKFDVKIDSGLVDEDIDKDLYGGEEIDEKDDDSSFASLSEAIDKEEGSSSGVGMLRTGDYADIFDNDDAKKEFAAAAKEFAAELGSDIDDDYDSYTDTPEDDDMDEFGDEPSDEDLLDINENVLDGVINESGLLVEEPAKRKRGRPRKNAETTEPPAPAVKKKLGRPRKNPEQ